MPAAYGGAVWKALSPNLGQYFSVLCCLQHSSCQPSPSNRRVWLADPTCRPAVWLWPYAQHGIIEWFSLKGTFKII